MWNPKFIAIGAIGSVQPPRVKTDECKDLRHLPAWLRPRNDTGNALTYALTAGFSFCWIYLLLLTLLTIRLFWPSHHWASQGFHFAGLNPISMAGLSRWPGEGKCPQNINWSLRFLRDQFLDPSSSPRTLNHWVPSFKHMVSHTIAMLMTHSSISHFDQMTQR